MDIQYRYGIHQGVLFWCISDYNTFGVPDMEAVGNILASLFMTQCWTEKGAYLPELAGALLVKYLKK